MNAHRAAGNTTAERLVLTGTLLLACLIIVGGLYISAQEQDAHWMNRAGAMIVTVQVIALAAEAARRRRLQAVLRELASISSAVRRTSTAVERESFINRETERSEQHALGVVLFLAAVGEILHGFGDLLVGWLVQ